MLLPANGLRFEIEVSFKQALRFIGSYAYHFWMKLMTLIRKSSGIQHLHRKPEEYRTSVRREIDAYRRMGDSETLRKETKAWQRNRNERQKGVDWQFTTKEARIKLKRLYPKVQE